ncbi:acetyl esterase/lipase [Litorimonas taeanensis]|uniref:Acetyl esterase/lipase n=1 Tax=Litorimonas taeanensis TaxID=568099 RepID=A0A420WIP3_9PROT|nr:alpha/beta hydrolase [Litorimonas taeanensis]RKQ70857.1 acetyl esterase/lipase [Litorimonas taeanensis]
MFHLAILGSLTTIGAGLFIAYRGTMRALGGPSLKRYDRKHEPDYIVDENSRPLEIIDAYLEENFVKPAQYATATSGWDAKRARFDNAGLNRKDLKAEYRDDVVVMDGLHVPGRWTLVDGYNPNKRILYYHGGAFTAGSDISHRAITVNLAKRTKAAIFVPNYRLMPENPRSAPIHDAQASYKWILENGPEGPAPLQSLAISGDSAGGNLTHMIANWSRDNNLRQADAIYTLSPSTDSTASGASFHENIGKDKMLSPLIGPLLKIPRPFLLLGMKKQLGFSPANPIVSPVFADLSNLPPTLVQASSDELLRDDCIRYVTKMKESGSPATLQLWNAVPHVFQIFDDVLPASTEAFDLAAEFLNTYL